MGIRAPIYLSVLCNEYAANEHPEWITLTPELHQLKGDAGHAFVAGWQIMDMSSPYQDYLADILAEVLKKVCSGGRYFHGYVLGSAELIQVGNRRYA